LRNIKDLKRHYSVFNRSVDIGSAFDIESVEYAGDLSFYGIYPGDIQLQNWKVISGSSSAGMKLRKSISEGFSLYSYNLWGQTKLVLSIGDPLLTGNDDYGYIRGNPTAGAYDGYFEFVEWAFKGRGGSVNFGDYKISSYELRDRLENFADQTGYDLTVVGGDRCAARNTAVGGSKGSRHLYGDAADIIVKGTSNRDVAIKANKSELFNTTIYYPDSKIPEALHPHVHVDLNPRHDNVLMIYKRTNGSNRYFLWNP